MLSYLQLRSQKVSPMSCDDEMEPNGTLQIFNTKNKAVVLVSILMRIWDVYSNKASNCSNPGQIISISPITRASANSPASSLTFLV